MLVVQTAVMLLCPSGYFGAVGQRCAPCPTGAACDGGYAVPVALAGYYPVADAAFVECTPAEACLGGPDASCNPLYTGSRCGQCAVGAYRYEAVPCATNVVLRFVTSPSRVSW